MYKITKPNKPIDSKIFENETGFRLFMIDNDLYVSGCENLEQVKSAIASHNPPASTEPTVQEKLASVGLSVDDLKVALGL